MNKRSVAARIYRAMLRLFPFDFQREFGSEMEEVFRDEHRHAMKRGSANTRRLWWLTISGFLKTAPLEHCDVLRSDIRYALRAFRKSPAFTFGTIAALAIGIGANLTIFGFANALLLRRLPVPEPENVVRVSLYRWSNVPYEHYVQYRDRNHTLAELAAFQNTGASLEIGAGAEMTASMLVSGNYFDSLRIPAALGRTIRDSDDLPGAPGVVMLSDGFWRERFGADPSVVGRSVYIDGAAFTIIGVTPPFFSGTMAPLVPQLWLPWNSPHRDVPLGVSLVGRIRSDARIADVRADLGAIAAGIARDINERFYLTIDTASVLHPELVVPVAVFATSLMALAGLVLLIACLNIASLLLARSTTRRKEIGIRLALGSSRGQLIRQLLTESFLLAFTGGLSGLGIAVCTGRALAGLSIPIEIPILLDFAVDRNLALFAFGISVATALLFGLAPALHAVREDIAPALKDGPSGNGTKRSRLRATFVIGQLGVSALLLVMAALLVRTLTSAQITNRQFVSENVLTATMSLVNAGYGKEQGIQFYAQLLNRIENAPGVVSASLAEMVPLTMSESGRTYQREGGAPLRANNNVVSRGHFRTLDIPILAGRDFTDADRDGAPAVCIVNERLAQHMWPGENPIGKRLRTFQGPKGNTQGPWMEVIGVAANSKYVTLSERPRFFLYQPIGQYYDARSQVSLLIRTRIDPMTVLPAVRSAVRDQNPAIPVFASARLDQATEISLLPMKIAGMFASILGLLALLLAATGIYGVVSHLVRNRTREIGIQIALGARSAQVMRFVAADAMRWTASGLLLGFIAALVLTQFLKNLIYGMSAADPVSFGGIAAILGATAYIACWIPARRATRVDPTVALRQE